MDVIEVHINEGADCGAENYFGETPVTYAIFGRRTSVIKHFLDRTAALQHVDKWGYTPILDAVFEDSHEILELLLLLDSTDTNVHLFDNKTLLDVTALNSDLKTIEILQNSRLCGLDTAAVDAAGYTPLDYARQRKDAADIVEAFGPLLFSIDARSANQGGNYLVHRTLSSSEDDEQSLAEVYEDALYYQLATLLPMR
jgi:ankyrin repeat protein